MELRELKYFLAIANEGNISKAAESLFMTQPSLSRQMQNLEKELGKPLFVRGNKKITLTETGILLKKRAEEILLLYDKTKNELALSPEKISGDIYIGSGESHTIEVVAQTAKNFIEKYPNVNFRFFSGDTMAVTEKLDKGLIDFGILVEPADFTRYDFLRLPQKDCWGVLMRNDSTLAQKEFVSSEDLVGLPLICSEHMLNNNFLRDDTSESKNSFRIVASYNLLYNAAILVKKGLGYAVGLDKIINTSQSELCFKPFYPKLESSLVVVWKKYSLFSKAAELFLKELKATIAGYTDKTIL